MFLFNKKGSAKKKTNEGITSQIIAKIEVRDNDAINAPKTGIALNLS